MKKYIYRLVLTLFCAGMVGTVFAQSKTGGVKGFVFNEQTGNPVLFANLQVVETKEAGTTDIEGYYSFTKMKPGVYHLVCKYIGFDSAYITFTVKADIVQTKNIYLKPKAIDVGETVISKKTKGKRVKVHISKTNITQAQLLKLPSVGGEADLVQYLQVLPGVVFTGDQGGQLYIRGGSPVMNKVLLDGMTIYNPFHSIGLFSVFDADLIKSADVYSAGFGAEYGGRISAIVDVKTRDGNKTEFRGKVAANPFTSKILLEGPLKKFKKGRNSSSYVISYKNSYLDRSSKTFYKYANPDNMPYSFSDFYGKMSFNSASGSHFRLFGFDFNDKVNFKNSTSYNWGSSGFGGKFLMVPSGSKTRVDGVVAYSSYLIEQKEQDQQPRKSGINGFNVGLNFSYKIKRSDFKYGIEINGFTTDFETRNSFNRKIAQKENTTEIAGFTQYRIVTKSVVAELGLRGQFYASLGNSSLEPRVALKYLITPELRLKGAVGMYSQNLLSAISDRDVVNLFYGFLSGPDNLQSNFDGKSVNHRLQKANHAVVGVEWDLGEHHEINIEGYIKDFTQITNINREKIFEDIPLYADQPERLKLDYIIESGQAYGGDFTYKYEDNWLYFWAVYSLNFVERFDGVQTYYTHYDRRHNVNLLGSVYLNKEKTAEISVRWNFGSGFPFTQTQGFFEKILFNNGVATDYTSSNGDLGIVYSDLNTGRLPYFHRMDISAKKKFKIKEKRTLELIASVTNVYDRNNIFYFDRVDYERVDQLPILPSFGLSYSF